MENDSKVATIAISGQESNSKLYSISVRSLSNLCLPSQTITNDFIQTFDKHLPIYSYTKAIPKLLIGMDNWKISIPRKIRASRCYPNIAATNTLLGWVVQGGQINTSPPSDKALNVHRCNCHLDHLMEKQYSLESFGVLNNHKDLLPPDDKEALKLLKTQTSFVDGKYTTGLLWKPIKFTMPNSRPLAVKRLECLERRMSANPVLRTKMINEIEAYEKKGYVRKLGTEEIQNSGKIWYLPIFPVFNKNKPDKFRVVWDAAAETKGISLNKMQFKGPDLVPSLVGVLLRFREGKYGVSADIAEMFHMIKINDTDENSQRFLWRKSPDLKIEEYVMKVMTFGSCSSPCAAQFIKNKNAEKFSSKFPRAVEAIVRNHYVDDFLGSTNSEKDAIELCKQVSEIHKSGGFHIRNWVSNSQDVLKSMASTSAVKGLDIQGDAVFQEKILGMWWVPEKDIFKFKLRVDDDNMKLLLKGIRCPTKRELLSILMRIYDPLGLINHFLIYAKVLLQKVWLDEIGWDVQVGPELFSMWLRWLEVLKTIEQLEIPRWHFLEQINLRIELHVFCDASKDAYSAAAYFRFNQADKYNCSLVISKARVAPKRIISIPRLELLAAVLAVRLADTVKKEHSISIEKTLFWSDSKSVIYWIHDNSKTFKQFVAFRVSEIREKSNPDMWRYVPSKQNVSDLATKWGKIPELKFDHPWYKGPDFLYEEDNWEEFQLDNLGCADEICLQIHSNSATPPFNFKVDINRFSKWRKLIGAVAYVLRAVTPKCDRLVGPLLKHELKKAEIVVIRQAQSEVYITEISTLIQSGCVNKDSKIQFLTPFIDKQGVLRAYGRLDQSKDLPNKAKKPIVLPHNHRVSFLLVDHYHRLYKHVHNNTAANEINQIYYVHKLRIALKTVRSKCQHCKNKDATPIAPLMSDLPAARLKFFTRPFSFTGMDYFGPMSIAIGRRSEKRWGVLMTCLTTRAIHIELASTLSSDSCIMALQRFFGRRGTPNEIYTDNATNFHGAEKELKDSLESIDRAKIISEIDSTQWFFIPPTCPHMGGCWERMVRSVKTILYQIMPTQRPSEELLYTILIQIENMINARPLCYVPVDHNAQEAITPNHFLLGNSSGVKPKGEFSDDKSVLRKNWMESERQANICWRRFIKEFIPMLTGRSKWFVKSKPIEIGDVVVIIDDSNPRNNYPKGIVIATYMGKNNQVRSAKIQTQTGVLIRPVVKLAVLKVKDNGMNAAKDLHTGGTVDN